MKSKEETVLNLFFNEPTKHWHFEEVLKKAKISRPQGAYWLKRLIKEGIVKKTKTKGKMPYYTGSVGEPPYKNRKRLYALNNFYKTGFLNHLQKLKAQTVIIFGSLSRSDWYKESDIDLFIYGEDKELEQGKYELKLKREIQVFNAKNEKELKKFGAGLLKNIITGYVVKGTLNFIKLKCQNTKHLKKRMNNVKQKATF